MFVCVCVCVCLCDLIALSAFQNFFVTQHHDTIHISLFPVPFILHHNPPRTVSLQDYRSLSLGCHVTSAFDPLVGLISIYKQF